VSTLELIPRVEVSDCVALDPQIRAFARRLAASYAQHPPLAGLAPAEARRVCEAVRAPLARGGPAMARRIERIVTAAGLHTRVRVQLPVASAAPLPAVVYLHGGGWHFFSLDSHDRLMREYAARAGVAVVGVDYVLAPEARYPLALQQVLGVFDWLQAQGAALGVDGGRLALAGDSAGANLALAAAMKLRATGRAPAPRALLLNYGAFCRETSSDSYRLFDGDAGTLTAAEMRFFWRGYLGAAQPGGAGGDPYAEPLRAPVRALCGLPPAFLAIAQCDVLRDDSVAMAERLMAAGVPTVPAVYEGACHSFLEAMETSALARRGLDDGAAWLRARLHEPG
jgi:acetyl esterase